MDNTWTVNLNTPAFKNWLDILGGEYIMCNDIERKLFFSTQLNKILNFVQRLLDYFM
jgi:hypothetical protein